MGTGRRDPGRTALRLPCASNAHGARFWVGSPTGEMWGGLPGGSGCRARCPSEGKGAWTPGVQKGGVLLCEHTICRGCPAEVDRADPPDSAVGTRS